MAGIPYMVRVSSREKPGCGRGRRLMENTAEEKRAWKVNHLIYAAGKDLHNTIRTRIALTEPVDAGALRKAADAAITRYPYFSVRLAREGETYVLLRNDAPLPVSPGGRAIPLGGAESGYHLFALAYDGPLLYVDTSHFLTDGYGKFPFIKTLLYCYLHEVHPEAVFDTAGIALPGSEIPPAEAEDDPFPAEEFPENPLGAVRRPEEAYLPEDQPAGYTGREQWTSFRMKIPQREMMKYASSVDGSPATFIASVMYRVLDGTRTDHSLPIVCGMQHQYRKALGKPFSHLCHVNVYPIVYTDRMRGRDNELLNVMARGTTIICTDDANDCLAINAHIRNEKAIRDLSLEEKHGYMKNFLLSSLGRNTFEVSYTGRVPFCGLERYITDFTPILDMSLSGGISVEIFSLGENFCVNVMQRNGDRRYTERFAALLAEYGIHCALDEPEHFEINDFVLPA